MRLKNYKGALCWVNKDWVLFFPYHQFRHCMEVNIRDLQ